ncbi:MAG TPA: hypothetical protein VHL59_15260 [Thermoanaerobaculia bacterium]|nr:hypothetical protein [Thermoanaerobaculia bacterium]
MRVALAVVTLLLAAGSSRAADPVYLDQLIETPLATLQTQFADLKKEGCYRIGETRYVLISMDKKDQKPWRVVLSSAPPCKRPETGPLIDVRSRAGIELGQTPVMVVGKIGRPDTANSAEKDMRLFGENEYFYVCRVSPECARHTSVFITDGVVTAIAEWYSE